MDATTQPILSTVFQQLQQSGYSPMSIYTAFQDPAVMDRLKAQFAGNVGQQPQAQNTGAAQMQQMAQQPLQQPINTAPGMVPNDSTGMKMAGNQGNTQTGPMSQGILNQVKGMLGGGGASDPVAYSTEVGSAGAQGAAASSAASGGGLQAILGPILTAFL